MECRLHSWKMELFARTVFLSTHDKDNFNNISLNSNNMYVFYFKAIAHSLSYT
jgi:hypothetical protein